MTEFCKLTYWAQRLNNGNWPTSRAITKRAGCPTGFPSRNQSSLNLVMESQGRVASLANQVLSEAVRVSVGFCALCLVVRSSLEDLPMPWAISGRDDTGDEDAELMRRSDFVSTACSKCGRSVSSWTANKVHENSCGDLTELQESDGFEFESDYSQRLAGLENALYKEEKMVMSRIEVKKFQKWSLTGRRFLRMWTTQVSAADPVDMIVNP
eukprot:g34248.t1